MRFPRLALASALILAPSAAHAGILRGLARVALAPARAAQNVACGHGQGVRFLRGVESVTVRQRTTVVYRSTVATCAPAVPTPAGYAVPLPTPQAPAKVTPGFSPTTGQAMPPALETPKPVVMVGDGPGEFLALLNAARAQAGRPALAWDASLAAYAATNYAVHAPGSSGGASQCWAGVRSYTRAFHMWRGSAAHWSLLMNATTSVGIAPCATGMTANCR